MVIGSLSTRLLTAMLVLAFGTARADAQLIDVVFVGSSVEDGTDGEPVPGGDGYLFTPDAPLLDGSGVLAFQCDLTGAGSDTAILRFVNGVLETVAREGDPRRGGDEALPRLRFPWIDGAGGVTFQANLSSIPTKPDWIVLRYPVGGGAATTIVRSGEPAPDGDGTFRSIIMKDSIGAGAVAFMASLWGTDRDSGVFRSDGEHMVQFARGGDPSPIEGTTFLGWYGLGAPFNSVVMNEAGEVAFIADLAGEPPLTAVFVGDGSELRTIAATGDPTPGGGKLGWFSSGQIVLNDNGDVALLTGGGIYRSNGGALTPIMQHGDPLPDSSGQFDRALSVDMNDAGQVVFLAELMDTPEGEDDDTGIYLADGTMKRRIAREGRPFGQSREFDTFEDPVINDKGHVAFVASLRHPLFGPRELGLYRWYFGFIEIIREGDPIAGGPLSDSDFRFATGTSRRGLSDDGTIAFAFRSGAAGVATWSTCENDLYADGVVDFVDVQWLLFGWGNPAPGDLDENGTVGFNDLMLLVRAFGPCP